MKWVLRNFKRRKINGVICVEKQNEEDDGIYCDLCERRNGALLYAKDQEGGWFGMICLNCVEKAFERYELWKAPQKRSISFVFAVGDFYNQAKGEKCGEYNIIKKKAAYCDICHMGSRPLLRFDTEESKSYALLCLDCIEEGFGKFEGNLQH